ncbi:TetR/AcrR family transcriptional regulator [Mycobacterium sp. CBMA271]|uniref:TetR/AcrR family transcriptional regulator n=1 Tax=unclassified Mycobacteroides TaxID=2618759 RepID=UPI0012DD2AC6|nr:MULTISPECIES: TetR/AcrR family transcriptional regulator [unclassified Mycobacteroides]MUM19949.1 TetR family transcriptional regulator [Mycobacteroides sp. CBMA 326]MUM20120.1 TetR/AcrR family transcriptional regulator [Mycobacteroides sp. CBMA 271]
MTKSTAIQRQRTPGRLNRSLDVAILEAAFSALVEQGYDAMNMDEVATSAGVGKAAIYRRWPSKAALTADALLHGRPSLAQHSDVSDTGSLRGDLHALSAARDLGDNSLLTGNLLAGIIAEAVNDPTLATALNELLVSQTQKRMELVFFRAIARGEIARDRDLSLVYDIPLGLSLTAALKGTVIDETYMHRMIDEVILPLVQAPVTVSRDRG